ncbi:hypothetical protein ABPG75_005599 [Micractinium tetrahymenae]
MVASGDVGLAFGLVIGAGAASCLGACIVFCVSLASPKIVASSLGFAAGVMLFVVFTEILMVNSYSSWQDASFSDDAAYRLSFACFFGGVLITAVLDAAVHAMMHWAASRKQRRAVAGGAFAASQSRADLVQAAACGDAGEGASAAQGSGIELQHDKGHQAHPHCSCYEAVRPGSEKGDVETGSTGSCAAECRGCGAGGNTGGNDACCCVSSAPAPACCFNTGEGEAAAEIAPGTAPAELVAVLQGDEHTSDLLQATLRSGVFTALVIALHNLPEGLASFVGGLDDTKVGASIAAAIAIHNIPEGICVAMPLYYATGSKWKGFIWGSLTGMAEPLGGLLGFLVLDQDSPLSFAVVFGIVAGMMVYVSIKELLPSALRFDPEDRVTSTSVLVGMAVIAFSLVLFTL